ncbi:MAG: radical SAM protein [Patescibacteria group bacterium]
MNQFRQKFKRADKNPVKDVVLAVTYQCNSRCRFCHIWKNKEAYSLFPIDYKNLPRDIKNVNISGGEPFLRRDLPRIIRVISRQCPQAKIIISTNGFSPSLIKKQIQEIIKFKRDIGVAVSIDGFGRVHEELRRFPGGFCLALETVRLLKELGLKTLRIAFTLGDQNINQLKKVYRLSRELGVEFSLAAYHNSSHYFRKQDNQIKNIAQIRKELNWLITRELNSFSPKRWLRAYFAYGLIRFLETKQRILPDYSGSSSLFIDPFGRIYPSDIWNLEIGRLQRINDWNKFIEIIKGITLSSKAPAGWMLCTARQSMRKHWFKVGQWILNRQTSKANIWLSEKFSSEQLFPFSK